MNAEIVIDICESGIKHQLKIGQPKNKAELEDMYRYRYSIYHKYELIETNSSCLDQDNYDNRCLHILATFDDQIVGTLRVIHGSIIPTLDYYYKLTLPRPLLKIARDKIFEVGRIIATPHVITNLISSHFILLMMFKYTVTITKEYGLDMSVGSMKERVVRTLQRLKFPIHTIDKAHLIYNPKDHDDPLTLFFDEQKTGRICPLFIGRREAESYFRNVVMPLNKQNAPAAKIRYSVLSRSNKAL